MSMASVGRGDDPNTDGPLNTPWYVWLVLAAITAFAFYIAFSGDGQRPGPLDPDDPIPTRPSVIMPVNSWSS
jgi:hypothetical protein